MQSGVFLISQNEAELSNPTNDIISQPLYSRLRQHITAGYFDAAKMEITRIIEYQQQSNLNAATLTGLYKTIIQLLGEAMSKHKISIEELYPDQESFALYQDGWKSLNQLRKLVTNTFNQLQILITDNSNQDFSIEQIINYIHDHIEEDIRRIDLAQQFHLNPDYLARVFKNETGQTLKHYISQEKINIAKGLLRTTNLPVGMIAAKIGFSSLSHFSKVYQKLTGLTPTEERTAK
jgi:two-component system response regulator YesN